MEEKEPIIMELKTELEKQTESQQRDARLEEYLKNYNGPILVDVDEAFAKKKEKENNEN